MRLFAMATRWVLPAQVFYDGVRALKGFLTEYNPLQGVELFHQGIEIAVLPERFNRSAKLQAACFIGFPEIGKKFLHEHSGEHLYRDEETLFRVNPVSVRGETAARHNAVQMRMIHQSLSPRMQDGGKPDLGARCFLSRASFSSVSEAALKSSP